MNLGDVIANIDPKWRHAFVRFIETGEAEQAFLDYLDRDKACQDAVEAAFTAQAAAFEDFAQALKSAPQVPAGDAAVERRKAAVMATMASSLAQVLELPAGARHEVLERTASTAAAAVGPERRQELEDAVEDLRVNVARPSHG